MNKQDKIQALSISRAFLSYLQKNNRSKLLPEIVRYLVKQAGEISTVRVFSPISLTKLQKKQAEKLVNKLTKSEHQVIEFIVDKSLIDGLRIMVNDHIWDYSLAGQLQHLKSTLI